MSFDALSDVNWLAVVVAALAYFALAVLWFAPPLFQAAWLEAGGLPPGSQQPTPRKVGVALLSYFLAATAVAMLARVTRTDSFGEALVFGVVVGIAPLAVTAVGSLFQQKPQPLTWLLVDGGFNLVGIILVAIIVGLWT